VDQEELPLEEPLVEPGVVRDQQLVAGEVEEPPDNAGDRGRRAQLLLAEACETGDGIREGNSRIHERLK